MIYKESHLTEEIIAPSNTCFYCFERILSLPFVTWRGSVNDRQVDISLHPNCAISLATHLAKDGKEAE